MLTIDEIRAMSAEQIQENWHEVHEALRRPAAELPKRLDVETLRRMSTGRVNQPLATLLVALK